MVEMVFSKRPPISTVSTTTARQRDEERTEKFKGIVNPGSGLVLERPSPVPQWALVLDVGWLDSVRADGPEACWSVIAGCRASLRNLLGEELSEFLASGERERRMDTVRSRVRLLRDLRMDTRAKGMWARLLNEQPNTRRHKQNSKKATVARSGCFGQKLDRIGTISGMGC
ncbi:hypothetical protein DPEC_G00272510 [Dallia pectoralis]|uniref:Uncharacterized protein n=1 Tax=Dallia pectoralis TaxID=75939 RepID=A0ACC2FQ13_DALPE|nr:hypothetical protein DPEC_G00272510 [Dallia pectoralis]